MLPGKNEITIIDDVVFISLGGRKEAMIDKKNWELVKDYQWRQQQQSSGKVYAVSSKRVDGKPTSFVLGRVILSSLAGSRPDVVGHINGDTLDCREENLEARTVGESHGKTNPKWRTGVSNRSWKAKTQSAERRRGRQ
jgi:hypothetical protein